MIAVVAFWACAGVIVWIYAGYPVALTILGRFRPQPRVRAPLQTPMSVIVAAHDEAPIIADKVENVLRSAYPAHLLEVVVVSDGSSDATVERAREAGAHLVIELPRVGKMRALNVAAERSSGEILVFSDADSELSPETLGELVSNFADSRVGAVAANEIHRAPGGSGVGQGEGLYWRYEQHLKVLEDRVGSTVSASGRLYAMRRCLFSPSTNTVAADDFAFSTQVILAGRRLAFDRCARVFVASPSDGGTEVRRKVRMMNQGLRGAFALMAQLSLRRHGPYLVQLMLHKVLRRFVGFFLAVMLVAAAFLAAVEGGLWWWLLGIQIAFYGLAVVGAFVDRLGRAVPKPFWVADHFCLSNVAAALAVLSLVGGTRFEMWEPALERGAETTA